MEDQQCNYCTKYSAFYWCPKCEKVTYCGKGCCRLDEKYHREKCFYLSYRPAKIKFIPAKTPKSLFGKFLSFVLYHWHCTYGIGFAECFIASASNELQWRIIFNKDISLLGERYIEKSLNFAVIEVQKEVLEKHKVSLITGARIVGDVTDFTDFEVGVYPLSAAYDNYYYFKDKIDVKSIGKKILGFVIQDRIGIYQDGKITFL
jgi:hypothetical protein